MSRLAFPYAIGPDGRTATTDWARHVQDLVALTALTVLGERVNRPDFGSNAAGLVFEAPSQELAATSLYLIRSALTQWLADLITVIDVGLQGQEMLEITIVYQLGLEPAPVVQTVALAPPTWP